MKAEKLYQKLEKDFIKPRLTDDWAAYMDKVKGFLSDNFKKRSMGVVCDFTDEINRMKNKITGILSLLRFVLMNFKASVN